MITYIILTVLAFAAGFVAGLKNADSRKVAAIRAAVDAISKK